VHTFGNIWTEQAFMNSKGKQFINGELANQVLKSFLLQAEVAVGSVNGYQNGSSMEAVGSRLTDESAI
jgi:hypothetical protein